MHPGGGLLNVDVLSFERLAHRVFEEVGRDRRQFLEETGKVQIVALDKTGTITKGELEVVDFFTADGTSISCK